MPRGLHLDQSPAAFIREHNNGRRYQKISGCVSKIRPALEGEMVLRKEKMGAANQSQNGGERRRSCSQIDRCKRHRGINR
jgi:hypothetical protein